jgi:hypothetical protein
MKTKKAFFRLLFLNIVLFSFIIQAQTPTYYWSMDNTTVHGGADFTTKNIMYSQAGKIGLSYATRRHENASLTTVSYIESPSINLTKLGNYSFTAWINVVAHPKFHTEDVENYLLAKKDQGNQFVLYLTHDGNLSFGLWNANNAGAATPKDIVTSSAAVLLNRWVHVAVTVNYTTKEFKLYLNGVLDKTGVLSGLPNGANGNLFFGNTDAVGDFHKQFNGAFDEVKLYNDQILTPDFILSEASKNITPDHLWRFNQDTYANMPIKDFLGYTDLVVSPSVTYAAGKIGSSAIVFDGNDDNAYTNKDISLTQNGNYSIAFWINPAVYPSGEGVIFNKRQKGNQIGGYLLADGRFRTNIWGKSNEILVLNSSSSIAKNAWTHIVITVDNKNKTAKLLVNNNLQTSNAFTFTPNSVNDVFEIGNKSGSATFFKGMVDDFRLYKNKVLTITDGDDLFTRTELKGVVNAPIRVDNFGQLAERQYDYEPKFIPDGEVTFDAANRPYMRWDKYVQTTDENGNWVYYDFTTAIKEAYPAWDGGADLKTTQETRVVFDAQDWAYTFVQTAYRTQTPTLKTNNLILYSTDHCKTWKILTISISSNVNWEIFSTNDPLINPPVLLSESDGGVDAYFFKKSGNTLQLEKLLKVADKAGLQVNHSGHGKGVISSGDNLVHVCYYGNVADTSGDVGTPMYVKTINRNDFTMTPAVYLGSVGTKIDDHNYPVIEMDSKKILHICFAGHHTKMVYRYSLAPNSTATWSNPLDVIDPKTTTGGNTYSSLLIDKNDNLHHTSRYSGIGYTFTVSYMTKPVGGTWQSNEQLLFPRFTNYHVWRQKLAMDRKGNLYLNYTFSNQQSVPYMAFCAYNNEWPEANLAAFTKINGVDTQIILGQNDNLLTGDVGSNVNSTCPSVYAGLLTLRSGETKWRLASTPDFTSVIASGTLKIIAESVITKDNIMMYPNPAKNNITLKELTIGDKIIITDMLGKTIVNTTAKQQGEVISTAGFTAGLYIVSVGGKTGLKLVKE